MQISKRLKVEEAAAPIGLSWAEEMVERIAVRVVQLLKEPRDPTPRLLTPDEAAKHLGRSKRWLRAAAQRGELKPVQTDGASRPRYDRAALDRWIEERS